MKRRIGIYFTCWVCVWPLLLFTMAVDCGLYSQPAHTLGMVAHIPVLDVRETTALETHKIWEKYSAILRCVKQDMLLNIYWLGYLRWLNTRGAIKKLPYVFFRKYLECSFSLLYHIKIICVLDDGDL